MQFHTNENATIHYEFRESGNDNPVIIFSNSLGTDFRIWEDVANQLSNTYSVLRYDKRGHGLSSEGQAPYSIEDHVSDLEALIEHLGIHSAVICGLSVGGMIAQGISLKRPDLIRAAILCDTAHKIGTDDMWQERIDALEAGGLEPMVDAIMERWFTEPFRRADNPVFVGCQEMLRRQNLGGYIGTCHALRDADFTDQLSALDMPVLCVAGDQDLSTSPELVQQLQSLIKGAEYVEIKDAGHIPCIEQPEQLVQAIRTFLDESAVCDDLSGASGKFRNGRATRMSVLGKEHVLRAEANQTPFDAPFQELITEAAWGTVWTGQHWTKRERSMVTIALLAALGHQDECVMHVKAAQNTGASREDIQEAMLHVAIYAGVPAANSAIKVVKEAFKQIDEEQAGAAQ